jgi:hypothetical protein
MYVKNKPGGIVVRAEVGGLEVGDAALACAEAAP